MFCVAPHRDALAWAQQTGLAALASGSSSSSPLSSSDVGSGGVWLPSGRAGVAAAAGSNGSSSGSSSVVQSVEEAPVGSSLVGLVRALVTHSSNSSRQK